MREYERAGYDVMRLSAHSAETVAPLQGAAGAEPSRCSSGQSGVGKSTLTNALVPESCAPTRTISESTGEGRHTTVSTALFRIPGGGELIDSPGVRDYAPPPVEDAHGAGRLAGDPRARAAVPLQQLSAPARARLRRDRRGRSRQASRRAATKATSGCINIMRGLAPEYERRQMRSQAKA